MRIDNTDYASNTSVLFLLFSFEFRLQANLLRSNRFKILGEGEEGGREVAGRATTMRNRECSGERLITW
jgi:hypothetical protein